MSALSRDAEHGALGFAAGKSCKMTGSKDWVYKASVEVECDEVDGPTRSEGVKAELEISMNEQKLASVEEVVSRLSEFRALRGYVNPQQGPMAAALPGVFSGYRVFYKCLVLDEKHLAPLEKEFVWLALLCMAGEMGAHHLKLFLEHGGTDTQTEAAFRIAGWVAGVAPYEFASARWHKHFPRVNAREAYRNAGKVLVAGLEGVPEEWAFLAMLSAQTGGKSKWGVQAALELCYAHEVSEAKMAEAMSVALWPCGANCFHDAAEVWLELIRSGSVKASAPFKAWAELPNQDGL